MAECAIRFAKLSRQHVTRMVVELEKQSDQLHAENSAESKIYHRYLD